MRLLCCYDAAVNLAALLAARFQLDADHGGRSSGGQLAAQHTGSTYVRVFSETEDGSGACTAAVQALGDHKVAVASHPSA
jgi:hypothetical protein